MIPRQGGYSNPAFINPAFTDKLSCTFAQVLWLGQPELHTTWEVADVLPTAVVQEFESGIRSEGVGQHCEAYGMDRSTFTTTVSSSDQRARIDRPTLEKATG